MDKLNDFTIFFLSIFHRDRTEVGWDVGLFFGGSKDIGIIVVIIKKKCR